MQELIYRFNRAVRKELRVTTDWKPLVITHKGKLLGVPEDVEQLTKPEKGSIRTLCRSFPWIFFSVWSRVSAGRKQQGKK